ncbi:MAG TPA: contractile injection system tape measure protein, partial [Kofleriaceae bacterium]
MIAQRHRIRRQVLEIQIAEAPAAWPLQSALSRLHGQELAAIVERCCTEVGDPGRLHRIDALEVDLGRLDPDHLERDLIERLGPALRQALALRIQRDDADLASAGRDPELESQLELVAHFACQGYLPWWADRSQRRIVDEALDVLVRRAAPSLSRLVRALARACTPLQRLVAHTDDVRLSAV